MAFCSIYDTAFGDNCKPALMANLDTVKSVLKAL